MSATRERTELSEQAATERRLMERYGREVSLLLFLVLLTTIIGVRNPRFAGAENLRDILLNNAYVAIMAVGTTMIIITGNIDISIGSMLAACAIVAGRSATAGCHPAVVIALTLGCGAAMGAVNGFLVTVVGIPAIIATLGTLSIFRGLVIIIARGRTIVNLPEWFMQIGRGDLAGVPFPVIIAVIVAVAASFVMSHTAFGREVYASGDNKHAARLAGVRVRQRVFAVFVINGLLVGLATLCYATRFGQIKTTPVAGQELLVITAVVVGGTDIFGGSGSILGSMIGVLLLGTIGTGLIFLKVSSFWERTAQGCLVVGAVILDALRRRKRERGF
ncbi:MAG TPA: ABC transporter permease [Candidatus Brocadiia bacterium]|nr:ABC transporter permease [Candidatus Brocadiia bacterium]